MRDIVLRFVARHGGELGDADISAELRELFLPKPAKDGGEAKPKPRTVSPKKNPKHKKPKLKANVGNDGEVELNDDVMNVLKGLRGRAYSAFQFESALEAYAESCRKDLQTRTTKATRADRLGFYASKHAGVTNGVGSFAEFVRYAFDYRTADRNRVEMSSLTENGRVKLTRMMKKLFGIELEIGAAPSWASASDRAKVARGEVNGIFDGERAWVSDVNGLVGTTLHEAVWHNVWAQCKKARAKLTLLGERVTPEEKERLTKLAALGDKMKEYVANVPQWLRDRVAEEYGYGERGGADVAEVMEEAGAFLFETEFEQELLDELDEASHKWWTKARDLFSKAFALVTGRGEGEDGEASFERAGGLSDAHAAMREMMDAVLASDGEDAVGVGEEGDERDGNDGRDARYSRAREEGEAVPLSAEEAGKKLGELVDDGGEVDVGGVSYSVVRPGKAFHVSAADFGKFDSSFMGTGEGQQAYGWGMYFLTRPEVWRHYRDGFSLPKEPNEKELETLDELVNVRDEKYDAYISERKKLDPFEADARHVIHGLESWVTGTSKIRDGSRIASELASSVRLQEASNLSLSFSEFIGFVDEPFPNPVLFLRKFYSIKKQILGLSDSDEKVVPYKQKLLDWLKSVESAYEEMRPIAVSYAIANKSVSQLQNAYARADVAVRMFRESMVNVHPYTYRVEFDETEENMLDWTKELTDEQFEKFIAALEKRNPKLAFSIAKHNARLLSDIHGHALSSEQARDISLALDDVGYIGHTMPVGGTRTDDYRDAHNYVIYNADDRVRITGKVRFSRRRASRSSPVDEARMALATRDRIKDFEVVFDRNGVARFFDTRGKKPHEYELVFSVAGELEPAIFNAISKEFVNGTVTTAEALRSLISRLRNELGDDAGLGGLAPREGLKRVVLGDSFGLRRNGRASEVGEHPSRSEVSARESQRLSGRASRVRRDSERNFEDMIDERVRACAAKTLASGADRRGEVLLTNDARNMGARERSYIKAKVMQICQIVRAAAKNRRFTPAEARGAVAMAAYNLAQSDIYSTAYEEIYCGAGTEARVRDAMKGEEEAEARGERPAELPLSVGYSKDAGEAARKLKLAAGQAAAMEGSEKLSQKRSGAFASALSGLRVRYGKDGKEADAIEAVDAFIRDAQDGALPEALVEKLRKMREGVADGSLLELKYGASEDDAGAWRDRRGAAADVLEEATRALGIAKAMQERGMPSVKDASAQNRAGASLSEATSNENAIEEAFEDLDPATAARRVVSQLVVDAWNKVMRALGVEGADAGFDAAKDDPGTTYFALKSALATARANIDAQLSELDAQIKSGVFTTEEKLEMNAERNRLLDATERLSRMFDEGSDFVRAFKADAKKLFETALGKGTDAQTTEAIRTLDRAETLTDAVAAAHELETMPVPATRGQKRVSFKL